MSFLRHIPMIQMRVNNVELDVYPILSIIKPHWERNFIRIKNLNGGFSCFMKHCYCIFDNSSSITFRVRNLFKDSPLSDSQFELSVLKILSERNFFPRIFATFENGYCYEYVQGKPLLNFPLRNSIKIKKLMLRAVATQLAEIHKIPIETETDNYFNKLKNLLQSDLFAVSEVLLTKETLFTELIRVETFVKQKVCSSSMVLSHGDLHIFNLLLKDNDCIQFLDWELTHVNHRAFDIAFFFQVLQSIGMANDVEFVLPEQAELNFIEHYSQHYLFDGTTIDVNALHYEVQIYKLVVLLYLMITQSIYADLAKVVAKNPKNYHRKLLNDYVQKKQALMGIQG